MAPTKQPAVIITAPELEKLQGAFNRYSLDKNDYNKQQIHYWFISHGLQYIQDIHISASYIATQLKKNAKKKKISLPKNWEQYLEKYLKQEVQDIVDFIKADDYSTRLYQEIQKFKQIYWYNNITDQNNVIKINKSIIAVLKKYNLDSFEKDNTVQKLEKTESLINKQDIREIIQKKYKVLEAIIEDNKLSATVKTTQINYNLKKLFNLEPIQEQPITMSDIKERVREKFYEVHGEITDIIARNTRINEELKQILRAQVQSGLKEFGITANFDASITQQNIKNHIKIYKLRLIKLYLKDSGFLSRNIDNEVRISSSETDLEKKLGNTILKSYFIKQIEENMDIKLEGKDKYYDFLSDKEHTQNILNKASKEGASRLDKALWAIVSNREYEEIILHQVTSYVANKLAIVVNVSDKFKVTVTELHRKGGNGIENNHTIPVSVFLKALNHRLTSKAFSNGIDLLEHVKDFYGLNYKNNIYYRFIDNYIKANIQMNKDAFKLLLQEKIIGSIYQNWNERPYATYVDKRTSAAYNAESQTINMFLNLLENQYNKETRITKKNLNTIYQEYVKIIDIPVIDAQNNMNNGLAMLKYVVIDSICLGKIILKNFQNKYPNSEVVQNYQNALFAPLEFGKKLINVYLMIQPRDKKQDFETEWEKYTQKEDFKDIKNYIFSPARSDGDGSDTDQEGEIKYNNENITKILLHDLKNKNIDIDIIEYFDSPDEQQRKIIEKLKQDMLEGKITEKFYVIGIKNPSAQITAASIVKILINKSEYSIEIKPVMNYLYSNKVYGELSEDSDLVSYLNLPMKKDCESLIQQKELEIAKITEILKLRIGRTDINEDSMKDETDQILNKASSYYESQHKEIIESLSVDQPSSSNKRPASSLVGDPCEKKLKVSDSRNKREVTECEISWDDIDKFNIEKVENRHLDKIIINSELFLRHLSYVKAIQGDMAQVKIQQLIQLASETKIQGKSSNIINKLIQHKRILDHLEKAGKIANIMNLAAIGDDTIADLARGDYKGVAINLGFLFGSPILEKISQVIAERGVNFVLIKPFLANAIKMATSFIGEKMATTLVESAADSTIRLSTPFIEKAFSALLVYDLVNQIKEFQSGREEALVPIVVDSVFLGIDGVEIGLTVAAELGFSAAGEILAIVGPAGSIIGVCLIVGSKIYAAVKAVDRIDKIIPLTGWEKFKEGGLAFLGMSPERYIECLIETKEANNAVVQGMVDFLKNHTDIVKYIQPSAHVDQYCREVSEKKTCIYGNLCPSADILVLTTKCEYKVSLESNNDVLLDKMYTTDDVGNKLKYSRSKPDAPSDAGLFCIPKGDYYDISSDGAYFCHNAIGVSYFNNRTGNITLFDLGVGHDYALGFPDAPNTFIVNAGYKEYTGGNHSDTFIINAGDLIGRKIQGSITGYKGQDTLILNSDFSSQNKPVNIVLTAEDDDNQINVETIPSRILSITAIEIITGRPNAVEEIEVNRGSGWYIDSMGGASANRPDNVIIDYHFGYCADEIKTVIRPHTYVSNTFKCGNYTYIIARSGVNGTATVTLNTNPDWHMHYSHHQFFFNYSIHDVVNITLNTKFSQYNTSIASFELRNDDNNSKFHLKINYDDVNDVILQNNVHYIFKDNTILNLNHKLNHKHIVQEIDCGNFRNNNKTACTLFNDIYYDNKDSRAVNLYIETADRLNSPIFVTIKDQSSIVIGSKNNEVIHNNPNNPSYLIGNHGENSYIVTVNNKYESDIIIDETNDNSSTYTVDLRQLEKQVGTKLKLKLDYYSHKQVALVVSQLDGGEHLYAVIKFRNILHNDMYERITIFSDYAMKISYDTGKWELKPKPLFFGKDYQHIVIQSDDIGYWNEVHIDKNIGNYIFSRINSTLVISNAFTGDDEQDLSKLISVILRDFYDSNKMQSLSIKFNDTNIELQNALHNTSTIMNLGDYTDNMQQSIYELIGPYSLSNDLLEVIGSW